MRKVTNEDVLKYTKMVEYFIKKSVVKNWKEATQGNQNCEVALGNTGYTIEDFRSYLMMEVVVALQKFNPDKATKESSFVWTCLNSRIGGRMKRLTKRAQGYGVWTAPLPEILHEIDSED